VRELSKYNIEAWLLDYHEGQLTNSEVARLLEFVEKHSELSIDFDFDHTLKLDSPDIVYADKTDLYKTELLLPDLSEEELECLAVMEGDMEQSDIDEKNLPLLGFLKETVLVPDQSIIFENKQALHKKRFFLPTYVYGAVATAAMLIIAWFVFSPAIQTVDPIQTAQDTEREIIFLDKLINPDEFDAIASSAPLKEPAKSRMTISMDVSLPERIDTKILANQRLATYIVTSEAKIINSSNAFVYRIIPYRETEEYKSFLAFSGEMIRKNVLGQDAELVKKSKFSVWELADVGLEKVSNALSLSMDIEREYNAEGKLVEVSFDSPLLAFSTPLNSQKAQ